MAFSPHWIDSFANLVASNSSSGARSENIVRIGDVLYGLFIDNTVTGGVFTTRKSEDAGVTWTDLGVAPSGLDSVVGANLGWFITSFVRNGKMEVFLVNSNFPTFSGNINNIYWTTYDPVGNSWSTPADTGLPFWFRKVTNMVLSSFFFGLRPDGSILTAFQDGGTFDLRISKWTPSDPPDTWTTLGGFTDNGRFEPVYFESGTLDASGNGQLFISRTYNSGSPSFIEYRNLIHVSVDAATDAVSSEHVIDSILDQDDDWQNYGGSYIGPGDSKGTVLAVPYGYYVGYNQVNAVPYGSLRVAIGDLSSDPLNPTWNVTTVTTQQSVNSNYNYVQAQNVILGAVLWVYFVTTDPDANPLDALTRLWRSSWNGSSWNTPVLWYDPVTDPTLSPAPLQPSVGGSTPIGVSNFYLLKAFTGGVGIVLNVFGTHNASPFQQLEYAAYDGPPLIPPVSNPGHIASKGKWIQS